MEFFLRPNISKPWPLLKRSKSIGGLSRNQDHRIEAQTSISNRKSTRRTNRTLWLARALVNHRNSVLEQVSIRQRCAHRGFTELDNWVKTLVLDSWTPPRHLMYQTLVAKVSTNFPLTICLTLQITSSISSASWAIHQQQLRQKCYRTNKAFKGLKRETRVKTRNLLVTYLAKALTRYTLASRFKEEGLNLKMISTRIRKRIWEVTMRRIWQIWTIKPTRDLLQHHQTKVLVSKAVKLCRNAQEELQAEIELEFRTLIKANQVFSIGQHQPPKNARTTRTIREIP